MSRVLINAKNKLKENGKANADKKALKKQNDADGEANGAGGNDTEEENL